MNFVEYASSNSLRGYIMQNTMILWGRGGGLNCDTKNKERKEELGEENIHIGQSTNIRCRLPNLTRLDLLEKCLDRD